MAEYEKPDRQCASTDEEDEFTDEYLKIPIHNARL